MVCTPLFANIYKHTKEYSEEIMGKGKVVHATDRGVFFVQYKKQFHVCIPEWNVDGIAPNFLVVNCAGSGKGTE